MRKVQALCALAREGMSAYILVVLLLIVVQFPSTIDAQGSISPIVIRGPLLYNSHTKERFVMQGVGYQAAASDDFFGIDDEESYHTNLQTLQINTIRLYNVDPDRPHSDFMNDLAGKQMYAIVPAVPSNATYLRKFAACRPDYSSENPEDTTSKGCYPACLLEYGKRIVKQFSQYNNTLAIVIGQNPLETTVTSLPCLKQYASDLKSWMVTDAAKDKMRILPLAVALNEVLPSTVVASRGGARGAISEVDSWLKMAADFIFCDDTLVNGIWQKSIDLLMINSYRSGSDQTPAEVRNSFISFVNNFHDNPYAMALGEFGALPSSPQGVRNFTEIPGIYSPLMLETLSGAIAFSFGIAGLSDPRFSLVTGGSIDPTGFVGMDATAGYAQLKAQYAALNVGQLVEEKVLNVGNICTSPTSVYTKLERSAVMLKSCTSAITAIKDFAKVDVKWPISSRQDSSSCNGGFTCKVAYPIQANDLTEVELCSEPVDAGKSSMDSFLKAVIVLGCVLVAMLAVGIFCLVRVKKRNQADSRLFGGADGAHRASSAKKGFTDKTPFASNGALGANGRGPEAGSAPGAIAIGDMGYHQLQTPSDYRETPESCVRAIALDEIPVIDLTGHSTHHTDTEFDSFHGEERTVSLDSQRRERRRIPLAAQHRSHSVSAITENRRPGRTIEYARAISLDNIDENRFRAHSDGLPRPPLSPFSEEVTKSSAWLTSSSSDELVIATYIPSAPSPGREKVGLVNAYRRQLSREEEEAEKRRMNGIDEENAQEHEEDIYASAPSLIIVEQQDLHERYRNRPLNRAQADHQPRDQRDFV